MFFLKLVQSVIKALHSDETPAGIAGGIALGSIIGLTPVNALHNYVIFFLILVLKVNIGMAFLAVAVFKIIAFAIDPLANTIGYGLLVQAQSLRPLWTSLYNTPIVPFTRFYNTLVLGSFIVALALFVPIYFASKRMVVVYRERWRQKVENLGFVKLLKLTSIFKIYERYK